MKVSGEVIQDSKMLSLIIRYNVPALEVGGEVVQDSKIHSLIIQYNIPALKVGGEVGPGRVQLAQLEGKKNVWLVACRRKTYIFVFEVMNPLAGIYDRDGKDGNDEYCG